MSGAGDQHISGFDHETGRVRRSYNKEQGAAWWRSGWYACEECRMKGRNYQRYADWCKRQQDAVDGVEVQQTRKQLKIDQKCQWEDLKDE